MMSFSRSKNVAVAFTRETTLNTFTKWHHFCTPFLCLFNTVLVLPSLPHFPHGTLFSRTLSTNWSIVFANHKLARQSRSNSLSNSSTTFSKSAMADPRDQRSKYEHQSMTRACVAMLSAQITIPFLWALSIESCHTCRSNAPRAYAAVACNISSHIPTELNNISPHIPTKLNPTPTHRNPRSIHRVRPDCLQNHWHGNTEVWGQNCYHISYQPCINPKSYIAGRYQGRKVI